jgi:hypothetical protein
VAVDGPDTSGVVHPDGSPCAVAVFVTVPAATSCDVVTYVAEQYSSARGANDACGQLTADRPESRSVMPTETRATFPVLVTANP